MLSTCWHVCLCNSSPLYTSVCLSLSPSFCLVSSHFPLAAALAVPAVSHFQLLWSLRDWAASRWLQLPLLSSCCCYCTSARYWQGETHSATINPTLFLINVSSVPALRALLLPNTELQTWLHISSTWVYHRNVEGPSQLHVHVHPFFQFSFSSAFVTISFVPYWVLVFFLWTPLLSEEVYFDFLYYFSNLSHALFCPMLFVCLLPSLLPPASSYPMVMTTTVPPLPHISIATGGVWGQVQALHSPSSLLPLHPPPPPPVPPVHGHVQPQPCSQTTLTTALWDPWYPHQECPAGRFVHQLDFDDQLTPILLVNSLCKPCSFFPDRIN